MAAPYLGEIQLFAFKFAPNNWAYCNGATLSLQQFTALFALLGATYGGDGSRTFQLPNFSTRGACEQGRGPTTSPRKLGDTFGSAQVSLGIPEMPAHNHGMTYFSQPDTTKRTARPDANSALSVPTDSSVLPFVAPGPALDSAFAPAMLAPVGVGKPHANQQPYLAVNFCIALQGEFPQFS